MKKDSEETLLLFLHSLILAGFFVALLVVAGLCEDRPWKLEDQYSKSAVISLEKKKMSCTEKQMDACHDLVDALNDAYERHHPKPHERTKSDTGKKTYTVPAMGE